MGISLQFELKLVLHETNLSNSKHSENAVGDESGSKKTKDDDLQNSSLRETDNIQTADRKGIDDTDDEPYGKNQGRIKLKRKDTTITSQEMDKTERETNIRNRNEIEDPVCIKLEFYRLGSCDG